MVYNVAHGENAVFAQVDIRAETAARIGFADAHRDIIGINVDINGARDIVRVGNGVYAVALFKRERIQNIFAVYGGYGINLYARRTDIIARESETETVHCVDGNYIIRRGRLVLIFGAVVIQLFFEQARGKTAFNSHTFGRVEHDGVVPARVIVDRAAHLFGCSFHVEPILKALLIGAFRRSYAR